MTYPCFIIAFQERITMTVQKKSGNPFGLHRVISPKGVLPQPAQKLDNCMDPIWDNELLIDVEFMNVDAASFTQIRNQAGDEEEKIKKIILEIIDERGKLQNPVTGSGGMFVGTVAMVGKKIKDAAPNPGDRIASLVSLSLTPLKINKILQVNTSTAQIAVEGKAILFESGIYARMPEDFSSRLSLAVLDVCGAPLQTERFAQKGDTVLIIGVTGKSGLLSAYAARRKVGPSGVVIGIGRSLKKCGTIEKLGFCNEVLCLDATDAWTCYQKISSYTNGRMADLVINCVDIPNTEMASILTCREGGTVYFFGMATSFTKAALGAEGVGKDINMVIGNGYARGHAEHALNILRQSDPLKNLFASLYG